LTTRCSRIVSCVGWI